jgi:hypothetical protein
MLDETFSCLSELLAHFEHHQLPAGVALSGAETYSDKHLQGGVEQLEQTDSPVVLDDILEAAALVKETSQATCSTGDTSVDTQLLLQWFAPHWRHAEQSLS